jgi:hypothetical protein
VKGGFVESELLIIQRVEKPQPKSAADFADERGSKTSLVAIYRWPGQVNPKKRAFERKGTMEISVPLF